MAYIKIGWKNNKTKLNDANLNHMEDGIGSAHASIDALQKKTEDLPSLKQSISDNTKAISQNTTAINSLRSQVIESVNSLNDRVDTLGNNHQNDIESLQLSINTNFDSIEDLKTVIGTTESISGDKKQDFVEFCSGLNIYQILYKLYAEGGLGGSSQPEIPENTLTDEAGNILVDENNNYLTSQ